MVQKAFSKFAAKFWHANPEDKEFWKEKINAKADGGTYYGYRGHKDFYFNYETDDKGRTIIRRMYGPALYYYAEVVGIRMRDTKGRDVALVSFIAGTSSKLSTTVRSSKSSKDACQAAFNEVALGDNDYAARIYVPGFLTYTWQLHDRKYDKIIPNYDTIGQWVRADYTGWFRDVQSNGITSADAMRTEIKPMVDACRTWCNHFNDTELKDKLDQFIIWADSVCKKLKVNGERAEGLDDYIAKCDARYDCPSWVNSLILALEADEYTEEIFNMILDAIWPDLQEKFSSKQEIFNFLVGFLKHTNPKFMANKFLQRLHYTTQYSTYYLRTNKSMPLFAIIACAKLFGMKFLSLTRPFEWRTIRDTPTPHVQEYVNEFNTYCAKYLENCPDSSIGCIPKERYHDDSVTISTCKKSNNRMAILLTSGRGVSISLCQTGFEHMLDTLRNVLEEHHKLARGGSFDAELGSYSLYKRSSEGLSLDLGIGCHTYTENNIRRFLDMFCGLSWEECLQKAEEFRKQRNRAKTKPKHISDFEGYISNKITKAAKLAAKLYGR